MSYRNYLKQKIAEIQSQIGKDSDHADKLREELKDLELKEFEEDLRESGDSQILLKG
jgi:septal ring factor EnvC (AmiA/AmiB activator)